MRIFVCFLAVLLIVLSDRGYSHPGGLDANGGHHDRKNGTYHFHNRVEPQAIPSSPSFGSMFPEQSSSTARTGANVTPRTKARTTARTEDRRTQLKSEFTAIDFVSTTEWRTWTTADGKFSTEARFQRYEEGKVLLEKRDGKIVRIPPSALSKDDQKYLEGELARRHAIQLRR